MQRVLLVLLVGFLTCGLAQDIIFNDELVKFYAQGTPGVVKEWLETGHDVNAVIYRSFQPATYGTSLTIAAEQNSSLDVIKLLIKYGADVSYKARTEWDTDYTPFIASARNPNVEIMKLLMTLSTDVASQKSEALWWAVSAGNTAAVRILLDSGAVYDYTGDARYREFPLLIAATNGDSEIVRLLLESGVNVNEHLEDGKTALTTAMKNPEVVRFLLEEGAEISDKDVLASTENLESLQLLQQRGVVLTPEKATQALLNGVGDERVIPVLLETGVDVNIRSEWDSTPLMTAAYRNQPEAVRILLEAGADVNFVSRDGETPLLRAVGCPDIQNYWGRNHNFQAIKDHIQVVKVLLEAGANINVATTASSRSPYTLFVEAAKYCVPETLRLLLEAGADVNSRDWYGDTAITTVDSLEGVRLLLESGADVNTVGGAGKTALKNALTFYVHWSIEENSERLELLLKSGADPNLNSPLFNVYDWNSPIEKSLHAFHLLIQAGAVIPETFLAKLSSHADALPLIKEAVLLGANVNAAYYDDTALTLASTPEIVRVLLDAGADIQSQGEKALSNAAENYDRNNRFGADYLGVINSLLDAGADVNAMIDRYFGLSYQIPLITYAMYKKEHELFDKLIQMQVDINKKDSLGRTPLFWVGVQENGCPAQSVDLDLLRKLLESGADVNARAESRSDLDDYCGADFLSDTPLLQAVRRGDVESVRLLVQFGADLDLTDDNGWTALDFAVQTGQEEIVKVLLEASQQ